MNIDALTHLNNLQIEGDSNEEKVFQEICAIIDNTIFIQGFLLHWYIVKFVKFKMMEMGKA